MSRIFNNIISNNITPSQSLNFTLGSNSSRWKDVFIGPGSINISGPVGSTGTATLGSDSDGIAYTEFGFATPFINIGPEISIPQAVGGWQVSSTGTPGTQNFDLVAQQNTSTGLTGPVYSLINNYTVSFEMTGTNYPNLFSDPGLFDFYQVNTTLNPINITLPSINTLPNNKKTLVISDIGGNLSNNNVTINSSGGNLIADNTSVIMNINYSSLQIASNGSNRWLIF